jgi:nucleotide-binding universal stress UspA family protein
MWSGRGSKSAFPRKSVYSQKQWPGIKGLYHIAQSVEDDLKVAAKKYVTTVRKSCKKKEVPCRTTISSGHPTEEIVKEVERSRSNPIILGSHGRSALAAVFLGSVTYGVVHKDTPVPVMIVRRGEKNK